MMRWIRLASLLTLSVSLLTADLLVSRGTNGVDRYSDSGVFLGNLIAPGGPAGLVDAQGVAVAANGDLLVGDFVADQILRYDYTGAFLNVFSNNAAVDTPFDVKFGPDGELFVASGGPASNIAQLNGMTGAILAANFTSGNPQPMGTPQYLEFGPNNVLYVTDDFGRLFRFDATTGAWISTGIFDNPEGVAYGPDDLVYLAQRVSNNIIRMPALSNVAEVVIPNGVLGGAPTDIAFGPNGLLYVLADQIYRFDVSGTEGVLVDTFGPSDGEFLTFVAPVPEPATWGLACFALLAGLGLRKRG